MAFIDNKTGTVSTSNNTTTPLAISGTFTGTAEDVSQYPSVVVACKSDVAGTLYIEFSPDGTNWDSSLMYEVAANTNEVHRLAVTRRFVRVRYVNGAVAQTTFRLQTLFGAQGLLTQGLLSTIQNDADAIVVRPTNTYDEIAKGKRQNATAVNKFGYNLDIDTGAEEIVAAFGGAFDPNTQVMTTAQTFTIVYNNTTDGLGQTGALSLLFTYLDANFLEQVAIHTLSNTGSDVTSFTGLGINRVVVLSNGGAGWNVNDITITATTDTTVQAQVPALKSVTQQCLFHTQIGFTFLLKEFVLRCLKLSGGSAPKVTIKGYSWSRVTLTRYEVINIDIDTSVENGIVVNKDIPFVFGGREVFYFAASTDTNNTKVSARFTGVQELS